MTTPENALASLRRILGPTSKIDVTSSSFGGLRISVLSGKFDNLTLSERRQVILDCVPDSEISHLQIFDSSEEEEFASDQHETLRELPLWPEALARGISREQFMLLPSTDDAPLRKPVIATFYSLRGGVGRSTALAHTAKILAAQGANVLCVDMDLEAPGLASLLGVEDQVMPGTGVVPLLLQTEISARVPDISDHVIPVPASPQLYLLPAGIPGADYARQLAELNPSDWYTEPINPLRMLFKSFSELSWSPDVVLVDARTGISPISAPLLFDVADIAIITFFPHPQAKLATGALTRALLASKTVRTKDGANLSPELRFIVSQVPPNIDVREHYENRALSWIGDWLAPARHLNGERVFDVLEDIVEVISYSEEIAGTDSVMDVESPSSYEPVAAWIGGFLSDDTTISGLDEAAGMATVSKQAALDSLRFSTGTAEEQEEDVFKDTFLRTDVIDRALSDNVPLVIGRKGTGKTAIFRELADRENSIVVTSPFGLKTHQAWMPNDVVYQSLADEYAGSGGGWRVFWTSLIGISLALNGVGTGDLSWHPKALRFAKIDAKSYSRKDLIADMRSMSVDLIEIDEWIRSINYSLTQPQILLFDGLDTGFGSQRSDLQRRREAVEGLLSTFMTISDELPKLKFKILIRDDIWRGINIANKSHLFGREARLAWSDQVDYLRVALAQAWRSPQFRTMVMAQFDRRGLNLEITPLEFWPASVVYEAWTLLVGERVSGGKTAFTSNWAWARLADANDDHSPRALLQLFHEATQRERRTEPANPYSRSIIRPRSMVESLDAVSEQALQAIREEFPELSELLGQLETIGTTPFDAAELQIQPATEALGREVGLLNVAAGNKDDVERYRVPELYRKALGMGRRGQA